MNNITTLEDCVSYSDVCRKLGFPINGTGIRKTKQYLQEIGFDTTIFLQKKWYKFKYPVIEKICPVCSKKFETQLDAPKEKTVCSISCSNTYFRSGEDNGKFTGESYRYLCFCYWERKCAIPDCNWDKNIEVHHIDDNHNNNDKKNLIPLCPNHHRLTVTNEWKDDIRRVIDDLIKGKWENT